MTKGVWVSPKRLGLGGVSLLLVLLLSLPSIAQGLTPRLPGPTGAPDQPAMGAAPAPAPSSVPEAAAPSPAQPSSGITDYVLGVGDKVQISVFGEDDLSGMFEVSSTGTISLPLIGEVKAAGQTSTEVQAAIVAKLDNGYMKDPHVSLQVSAYRPFFIVGEVMKPGSYTYVNGMTVINAVALAGGYTYRADKESIKVKHGGPQGKEVEAGESATVVPGDVVTIPQRFF